MDATLRFLRLGACALSVGALTVMLLADGGLIGVSFVVGLVSAVVAAAIMVTRSTKLSIRRRNHSGGRDDSFTESARTVEALNKQMNDSGWG